MVGCVFVFIVFVVFVFLSLFFWGCYSGLRLFWLWCCVLVGCGGCCVICAYDFRSRSSIFSSWMRLWRFGEGVCVWCVLCCGYIRL